MYHQFQHAECGKSTNEWQRNNPNKPEAKGRRGGGGQKDFCGDWRKNTNWESPTKTIPPEFEIPYNNYGDIYKYIIERWARINSWFEAKNFVNYFKGKIQERKATGMFEVNVSYGNYNRDNKNFWVEKFKGREGMEGLFHTYLNSYKSKGINEYLKELDTESARNKKISLVLTKASVNAWFKNYIKKQINDETDIINTKLKDQWEIDKASAWQDDLKIFNQLVNRGLNQ